VLAVVSPRLAGPGFHLGRQLALQALFYLLAVAIVVLVVRYERLPLDSIGLRRPDRYTVPTALALFMLGLLLQVSLIGPLVERWGQAGAEAGVAELAALPVWFRLLLGTGGAVEELLYRGYAVERLGTVTKRRWLGAVLATAAFALAHVPAWGLGFALVADLPAGILLVSFYLWRRDLIANMLAHSAGIMVAMLTVG
jgi:membrane protease YdiL (CAAX protease family)